MSCPKMEEGIGPYEGSDSGVEEAAQAVRSCRCRLDLDIDGALALSSCNSSEISGSSPCCADAADIDDLISGVRTGGSEWDGNSDNGSESSERCKSGWGKCAKKSMIPISSPKPPPSTPVGARRRKMETTSLSRSSSTTRRGVVSPEGDEKQRNSCNGVRGKSESNALVTYGTLPRRKPRLECQSILPPSREPSLNRAASLRKKYVESNGSTPPPIMSTSFNAKFPAPSYHKPPIKIGSKTKIYHETSTQTSITWGDMVAGGFEDMKPSKSRAVETKDKNHQVEMAETAEVKKVKKECEKQRTVIEYMEGEMIAGKDERRKLREKLALLESKMGELNRNKSSGRDESTARLEKELAQKNAIISKQNEELSELKFMYGKLEQDLMHSKDENVRLDEQRASLKTELAELDEFLRLEKSAMRSTIQELEVEREQCQRRLMELEKETNCKSDQSSHLVRASEQQRQENMSLKAQLAAVETRSRELLLQQGAAISSASVAISSLSSRWESIRRRLAILEDGITSSNEKFFKKEHFLDCSKNEQVAKFLGDFVDCLNYSSNGECSKKELLESNSGQSKNAYNYVKKKISEIEGRFSSEPSSPKYVSDCSAMEERFILPSSVDSTDEDLHACLTDDEKRNSLCPSSEGEESESLNRLSEAILQRQQMESGDREGVTLKEFACNQGLNEQIAKLEECSLGLLKDMGSFLAKISGLDRRKERENCSPLRKCANKASNGLHFISSPFKNLQNSKLKNGLNKDSITIVHQCKIIDEALIMLRDVQSEVGDSPTLKKIQQHLEEANSKRDATNTDNL